MKIENLRVKGCEYRKVNDTFTLTYYEVNENRPFGEETLFDQMLAFKQSII